MSGLPQPLCHFIVAIASPHTTNVEPENGHRWTKETVMQKDVDPVAATSVCQSVSVCVCLAVACKNTTKPTRAVEPGTAWTQKSGECCLGRKRGGGMLAT